MCHKETCKKPNKAIDKNWYHNYQIIMHINLNMLHVIKCGERNERKMMQDNSLLTCCKVEDYINFHSENKGR